MSLPNTAPSRPALLLLPALRTGLLLALVLPVPGAAQQDSETPAGAAPDRAPAAQSALEIHRAEVRVRYGQARWPLGELRAGLPNELELPGFVAEPLQSEGGRLTRAWSRAGAAQPGPVFVLETFVADTREQAQEELVTWLAGLQSAQRMPSAAEVGLVLGDAAFVGRSGAGPDALAWVAFARGNVAARLVAFGAPRDPGLELGPLARLVDEAILRGARLAPGRTPAKPIVSFRNTPRAALVAGTRLRLDVSVVDPAGGTPHFEWVVGGPGQGYVERAPDGTFELHATAPGALTLALEATGSLGTFARETLELNVLDD